MNEQTIKLIEKIAQKLGTTSEYLWSILLKQAHIDATLKVFLLISAILLWILLFKIHLRFHKKEVYEEYEEIAVVPMVIATTLITLFSIISFFCIPDIFNGYFNPEYWALKRILD